MIDAIGPVEEITQSAVVFSAFAGKDDAQWIVNLEQGDKLIVELQAKFPKAQGPDRNIVHGVNYVPGFLEDDELFRYFFQW